jgi:NAD(P)-dependent dehydrogenase (short-subunit alcohol dehydrogenase family)
MTESTNQRCALVTGGGGGLGREFCLHLARKGWHVGIADINAAGAEEALAGVLKEGGSGLVETLDVADVAQWQLLIAKLRGQWPRLDLLVNNAGICGAGKIGEYPLANFRRIVEVNLMGVVNGCHMTVPWMLETAPGGQIVNVASIAPALNAPTMAAYNTAKAGVIALSETLHGELRPRGIGVTTVMPGFFRSQLLEKGTFDDEGLRNLADCLAKNSGFTAADVVEQTMRAVARGHLHVILGRKARLAWRLKRLAPRLFHRYVAWSFERDTRRAGGNPGS